VETAEPVINAQTLALNFTNEGGVANTIRFLKNVTGFWLLQQVRQQWRKEGREYSWEDLLNQAERADPFISLVDPDDDLFLHPDSMPAAIWSYCENTGQRKPESVGEFVRCCLESMALKYRYVIESFETLIGRRIETIRIVGGGSRNRLLSQFTADACQRQVITGPVEATTLGNIMMQAIATGHLPDVAAGRAAIAESFPQETFEPRQGQADEWDAAYARFTKLLAG
jgi:rhamnulokinase